MSPRLSGHLIVFLVAISVAPLPGQGQTGQKAQAFEVASIKPNRSDAPGVGGLGFAPGGIRARNQSPVRLLEIALSVQPDQVVGAPSWATNEGFDINAKVGSNVAFNPMTMLGPMLFNLLESRFQLKMHHETRELNVYRLVRVRADRLGPKLAPAPIDACSPPAQTDAASLRVAARGCSAGPVPGGIDVHGMPLATLASLMGPSAGRVIVDATGLTGNWDLEIRFAAPGQNADADSPSLFTALGEQLGLKLESGRAPVDVIVIDHVERPTPD
jgi:uncharacterized protein (TIGR03435 family)